MVVYRGRPTAILIREVAMNKVLSAAAIMGIVAALLSFSGFGQSTKPSPESQTISTPAKAIFAGGCFWCMEPPFDKLDGVIATTSGYTGGSKKNPTYEEVSSGRTGHTEAVEVAYDPKKVSYQKLLEVFWQNIDPTVKDQQFCDVGSQYRSGIFYLDEEQKRLAEASKAAIEKNKRFSGNIVTEITRATAFYPAEDYHQDFYKKNPLRYKFYRNGCGRDQRLQALWGKSPD
jgi:peptide-methionine (S)-S-oxide reductase